MTTLKILSALALMIGMVASPAILATKASAQYTNGYYHGPRDGQCYNNKRGC